MGPSNVPYSPFLWVLMLKTSPSCPSSISLWLKPHPLINEFSIVMAHSQWLCRLWRSFIARNGGLTKWRLFSKPDHAKEERNGLPVPTNAFFLEASSEEGMWFSPFGCTHPPPPVLPFLLVQKPKSQGCCRKWHPKLKICQLQWLRG